LEFKMAANENHVFFNISATKWSPNKIPSDKEAQQLLCYGKHIAEK
jgi:hypothetical protein